MKRKGTKQNAGLKRRLVEANLSPEVVESARLLVQQNNLDGLRNLLEGFSARDRRELFKAEGLQSSLHTAFTNGNLELMLFLLQRCQVPANDRNADGQTVLYLAVRSAKVLETRMLLSHGARLMCGQEEQMDGCFHQGLLQAALLGGNADILALLLEAGLPLRMWPESHVPSEVFGPNFSPDLVKCAIDHGLCTLENVDLFKLFMETAAGRGSPAFRVLWSHKPRPANYKDDFRLALLTLGSSPSCHENIALVMREGSFTNSQRTDLYEYYGAQLISRGNSTHGLLLWERAMQVRWSSPWTPVLKRVMPLSVARLLHIKEPDTIQELQVLDRRPQNLQKQALLVCERVCNERAWVFQLEFAVDLFQNSSVTEAFFVLNHVVRTGKYYKNPYPVAIKVCWAFRKIFSNNVQLPKNISAFRVGLLLLDLLLFSLEELIRQILDSPASGRHNTPAVHHCPDCEMMYRLDTCFCNTVELLLNVRDSAQAEDMDELTQQVTRFIRCDPRLRMHTRLHTASQWCHPNTQAIQLLVECSARVGGPTRRLNSASHLSADHRGNSPLHILASKMSPAQLLDQGTIACFQTHGAHLCARGQSGSSVLDILQGRGIMTERTALPLECLAARAVRRAQDEGVLSTEDLPPFLRRFLMDH